MNRLIIGRIAYLLLLTSLLSGLPVKAAGTTVIGTVTGYTKLAHNTNGGPPLTYGDYFGSSLAAIGDLDRDGVQDLAIGARDDDTGGGNRGAVYIAMMNADGSINSYQILAHNVNGGPVLADSDSFGSSVAAIGDLNRDGVGDLAIGAYGDDTGGSLRGAVYVAFMKTDGTILSKVKLASGTNGAPALSDGSSFGMAVAAIGDLDRDGVGDIAIGASGDSTGGFMRGAVYVSFMNIDGTIKSWVKLASETNGIPVLTNDGYFGSALASIGDMDRDGVRELVIGAPGDSTGGTGRGAVYIAFMNLNGTIKSWVKLASGTNGAPELTNNDYFGNALASIGDLDRDGLQDLAIGTPFDATGGSWHGAVYLAFMNANGTIRSTVKLADSLNGIPALADGDRFGTGVAWLGDLDRDGAVDIAVGAPGDETGGSDRGAVYVLNLAGTGLLPNPGIKQSLKLAHNTNGGPSLTDLDDFGRSVAAIGDLDRDGIRDLAIGAYGDDTGGSGRGAVYIAFMQPGATISSTVKLAHNTNGGPALDDDDSFGVAVTVIGDLDRDGVQDLAIGAPFDDTGGANRGAVYLAFMNANGTISSTVILANLTNGGPSLANLDGFGFSVAGIGDLDRDGIEDLAIGVPYSDFNGGSNRGVVYVALMNANGTIKGKVRLGDGDNGCPALSDGDLFGWSVNSIGDLDRDGVQDLAIGAIGDDTGGDQRGAVYLAFMQDDGTIKSTVKLANNTNGGPALANQDWFGAGLAGIGDLDRDGIEDLVIGATGDDTGGDQRGAVYLAFMQASGVISSTVKLAYPTNGGPTLADDNRYGLSLALVGDLNRDGVQDIAVGAPGDKVGATARGAVYLSTLGTRWPVYLPLIRK